MATYISLIRFTQQGVETIKDSPARLDMAKQVFKSMGASVKEFYLVTGQYDAVVIGEAPDDETMAKLALTIGATGAIRTESFRAFTEDEYRKIIAALS
ncbi:MAG: GYD domain-containing protein [Dehalococcoidales bacterium]|nr:MAG: GYD domain-containing protein [Dehalococcoidales bacterium]